MAATKPIRIPSAVCLVCPTVEEHWAAAEGAPRPVAAQFSAIIPCVCGVAWATLRSVADQGEQSVATYICPRCGHLDQRIVAV